MNAGEGLSKKPEVAADLVHVHVWEVLVLNHPIKPILEAGRKTPDAGKVREEERRPWISTLPFFRFGSG
jgi:hypothetical protein